MIDENFINSKLVLVLAVVASFILNVNSVFAAEKLFEADGVCIVGNIGIENIELAKRKAEQLAITKALEQAGVTIVSMTEMKNNSITKDEVKVFAKNYARKETSMSREFLGDEDAIKYICHVKLWIDTDAVIQEIPNVSKEKMDDQVKMNKDQESYREKNETEIAALRERYKNAANDNERQETVAAIKRNEDKVTSEQLYQQGVDCYNKGDLAEAAKFYNQAIEKNDSYAAPYTGLGWIYNDQGQFSKAIECFQKSISLYDGFAVPYNGLSYAYNFSNDYNKAIEYGNKAVQLDPKYAAAWNNIGFAYNNLGNYNKAVEYYNKAIAIAPNDEVPLANLGTVYFKQKQYSKAMEYYQKSIQINSNHSNVWYHMGHIYGENKEIDKAIESYKKATTLDPKNVRAWTMMGYLYNSQKKYDDAKKCFKKALKLNPNSAAAWAGLGFACDGLEDYGGSHEAYKKAVEIEPTNDNYKKNLEIAKQKI